MYGNGLNTKISPWDTFDTPAGLSQAGEGYEQSVDTKARFVDAGLQVKLSEPGQMSSDFLWSYIATQQTDSSQSKSWASNSLKETLVSSKKQYPNSLLEQYLLFLFNAGMLHFKSTLPCA